MYAAFNISTYFTLLATLLTYTHGKTDTEQVRSHNLVRRDTQTVTRRGFHSSVVLGKYVFIVGGEVSINEPVDIAMEMNHTLVIDMSTSWDSSTAIITVLDIPSPPHLNMGSIWTDSDGITGYYFGGESGWIAIELQQITAPQLYKFIADDSGSGSWTTIENLFDVSGNLVDRPVASLAAYGNGSGYMLGGHSSQTSSTETTDLSGNVPLVGMIAYDIKTNTWMNNSASGYSASGIADSGTMEFISNFGPAGLLMPLGGSNFEISSVNKDRDFNDTGASFSNLTVWEPISKKWYFQTARGSIPEPRESHCSVGVSSTNGTFEIFLYGGQDGNSWRPQSATGSDNEDKFNEVFVLSLPAFMWFRADSQQSARWSHTCHVVGNRQMLSIGGLDPTNFTWNTTDPWPQSLGIFDMTEMAWRDTYDPDAAAYASPNIVQQWYNENGYTPASGWSSPDLAKLFTLNTEANNTSSSSKPMNSASSSTTTATTDPTSTNSKNTKNLAAIIGGSLGGITLLILIIIVYLILHIRSLRGKPGLNEIMSSETVVNPLTFQPPPAEMYTDGISQELPESSNGGAWEMDVKEHSAHELAS